jgi:hypothetical protein
MITPSPTTRIAPHLARGVLERAVAQTATRPAYVVISVPDTSYQIHLLPTAPVTSPVGKRIVGTIELSARRIDSVETGGRYLEPVMGRPRRVQGTVIAAGSDTVTVDAGVPVICRLTDARQSPGQFKPGDLVSFDALEGATFTPQA